MQGWMTSQWTTTDVCIAPGSAISSSYAWLAALMHLFQSPTSPLSLVLCQLAVPGHLHMWLCQPAVTSQLLQYTQQYLSHAGLLSWTGLHSPLTAARYGCPQGYLRLLLLCWALATLLVVAILHPCAQASLSLDPRRAGSLAHDVPSTIPHRPHDSRKVWQIPPSPLPPRTSSAASTPEGLRHAAGIAHPLDIVGLPLPSHPTYPMLASCVVPWPASHQIQRRSITQISVLNTSPTTRCTLLGFLKRIRLRAEPATNDCGKELTVGMHLLPACSDRLALSVHSSSPARYPRIIIHASPRPLARTAGRLVPDTARGHLPPRLRASYVPWRPGRVHLLHRLQSPLQHQLCPRLRRLLRRRPSRHDDPLHHAQHARHRPPPARHPPEPAGHPGTPRCRNSTRRGPSRPLLLHRSQPCHAAPSILSIGSTLSAPAPQCPLPQHPASLASPPADIIRIRDCSRHCSIVVPLACGR